MKKNKRILKNILFALSSALIIEQKTLDVRASNDAKVVFEEYHSNKEIEKEKRYRYEHQIDEDVELIYLEDKTLIKTVCDGKTKHYLCSKKETDYLDRSVSQENIRKLFQGTPSEKYINNDKPKYVKKSSSREIVYTDLTNEENKFIAYVEPVNVCDGFPSDKNNNFSCWGDIITYSNTIMDEIYTEYKSFDPITQKTSVHYDNEPEMLISINYSSDEIKEIWEEEFITKEDLECVISLLNSDIPVYKLTKP